MKPSVVLDKQLFSPDAGDQNFSRNLAKRTLSDAPSHPVVRALDLLQEFPDSYLEVGCSSGYLVEHLRRRGCIHSVGLDVSPSAIKHATAEYPESFFFAGNLSEFCSRDTNDSSDSFEVVHLGFYMFVLDPSHWLGEIMLALSLVKDGGILVIHDFYLPGGARSLRYRHDDRVTSSKAPFFAQLDFAIPGIVQEFRLVRAAQVISNQDSQPHYADFEGVFIYRKMRIEDQFLAT